MAAKRMGTVEKRLIRPKYIWKTKVNIRQQQEVNLKAIQ